MYKAIAANKRNTVVIMAMFIGVIGALAWLVSVLFGNRSIGIGIMIVAGIYALIQYFIADKFATMSMGAQEITKADNPRLWRIVENLAITKGMPMPKVYLINDPAPNAFATGRDPKHAIVGATTGILDIMTDRELTAVMAHEIGHVENYDIRVSTIAFGLVSAVGLLSDLGLHGMIFGGEDDDINPLTIVVGVIAMILAPIAASLIQLAISRQREYLADASGALTTRDSEGLASALEKLETYGRPMQQQSTSTAHLFFSNPLKPGMLARLFSTHPPLQERIDRLRKNARKF